MTTDDLKLFAENEQKRLKARSGAVKSSSRLVSFLYQLMRDHVLIGNIEKCLCENPPVTITYTNGFLVRYAEDVAARLLSDQ